MQWAVMVAGLLAEIVGWWFVSARGRDVWRLMPIVLGTMGVAAVLARPPVAAAEVTATTALAAGLASGLALFLGTRVFVWAAAHWEPFRRDVVEKYSEAAEVSLRRSLLLSLVIMVPSEELFWRGLFQGRLAVAMAAGAAAVVGVGRIRRGQHLEPLAADRGGRRGGRGAVDRARLVVGRRAGESREPYPVDGVDARAAAGSRPTQVPVPFRRPDRREVNA